MSGLVILIIIAFVILLKLVIRNSQNDFTNSNRKLQNSCTNSPSEYEQARHLLKSVVREHFRALITKRNQLIFHDSYGNQIMDDWVKELKYFYDNVYLRIAYERCLNLEKADLDLSEFMHLVDQELYDCCNTNDSSTLCENDEITPLEFENMCKNILIKKGWSARTTKGSGDQGVDIIAENANGIKAVFQCKFYSGPVGNKAVQEIFAGKKHEMADIAAVVTNSRFTKAAEQLAHTCDVLLLHYSELEDFHADMA